MVFWDFRDMWGTIGMVWSWRFSKWFHISCWPFRSGVIEQNEFTWFETLLYFNLWSSGTCGAPLECSGLEDSQSGFIFLVGLFVPEFLNKTLVETPLYFDCDLAAVILRFQGHVTVGMFWSWRFSKWFHISCWPFRSGVIEQNEFTWFETPLYFDLWSCSRY